MTNLKHVKCIYTGGGIYNYSALYNDEVWLFSDFELTGSFDRPYLHTVHYDNYFGDVEEEDPDAVEKMPSVPFPTWKEVIDSLNDAEEVDGSVTDPVELIKMYHPNLSIRMNEEDNYPIPEKETPKLTNTTAAFIETMTEVMEDNNVQIPESVYSDLADRFSKLLVNLGLIERKQ